MLITQREGGQRDVPQDGETMAVHGVGGFLKRGCPGGSTSDIRQAQENSFARDSPSPASVVGTALDKLPANYMKEHLVEVELGQGQTRWPRAEEEGEQNQEFSSPKLLFLHQASCVRKKAHQFQCSWEM